MHENPKAGDAQPQTPNTRTKELVGEFSPLFVSLTDDLLYADIWNRPALSLRERSLITVASLITVDMPTPLRSHIVRARKNGVTRDEIEEIIVHLAFYAGWPKAFAAIAVARDVFESDPESSDS